MTDYVPIDCEQHSLLEVLALRRRRVSLVAGDGHGALVTYVGTVSDVVTRDRGEFLVLETDAGTPAVRLDRLREISDTQGDVLWRQNPDKRVQGN